MRPHLLPIAFVVVVALASGLAASRASAQAQTDPSGEAALEAAPELTSLSSSAAMRAELGYHVQRRTGIALMATGVASHLAGAGAATFGLITLSLSVQGGGRESMAGFAMFVSGLAVSGVGMLAFIFGLVLDVDARVRRGRQTDAARVALTPDGFAVHF